MEQIENSESNTQQEPFNRPPRIWPRLPDEVVTFPAPPEEEREAQPPNPFTLLLPLLSIGALLGISIILNHGSFQQLALLLPIATFTLVNPLTSVRCATEAQSCTKRAGRAE